MNTSTISCARAALRDVTEENPALPPHVPAMAELASFAVTLCAGSDYMALPYGRTDKNVVLCEAFKNLNLNSFYLLVSAGVSTHHRTCHNSCCSPAQTCVGVEMISVWHDCLEN